MENQQAERESELLYELIVAIQDNNYEKVQAKITAIKKNGGDINVVDDNFGRTPLIMAIEYSRDARGQERGTKIIEALIHAGANVNMADETEQSPLLHAIYRNNADVAQVLVDHGANYDKSTIHEARRHGAREIVDIMTMAAAMPAAEMLVAEMSEEEPADSATMGAAVGTPTPSYNSSSSDDEGGGVAKKHKLRSRKKSKSKSKSKQKTPRKKPRKSKPKTKRNKSKKPKRKLKLKLKTKRR